MIAHIFKRNLRAKVTLGIVFPLIVILGIFTSIEHSRQTATNQNNLSELAAYSRQVVESNLRHAMLEDDLTEVQTLLDAIGSREEFEAVYVLDASGRIIFAPAGKNIDLQLDQQEPNCQLCHRLPPDERPSSVVLRMDDGQRVFRSMYPLENQPECSECHDPEQRLLGLLITDITMEPMEVALASDLRETLLWWLGVVVMIIIVVNLVISRFVLRRLEGLAGAIAGLGQGKLPPALPETQIDEIGRLAAAFNLMVRQIETRNQENKELSENLRLQSAQRGELLERLITAQEDERTRVARELHDELGQSLSGLGLCAQVMEHLMTADPDRARTHLAQIQTLIATTTDQMYDLILDLRPSALDDLGLVAALRGCMDRILTPAGISYKVVIENFSHRLPPTIETAAYRIFQEALNNVLRHSAASEVQLELKQCSGTLEGTLTDDGIGFDPDTVRSNGHPTRGLGLMGMRERVAQCGGHLDIISKTGQGTCLKVFIPIEKEISHD